MDVISFSSILNFFFMLDFVLDDIWIVMFGVINFCAWLVVSRKLSDRCGP